MAVNSPGEPHIVFGGPPQDVRLLSPDGRIYECDVLRDPDLDRDGKAMWVAVPREPVIPVTGKWRLAAVLQPRSSIMVRLPRA